jgi:hypothetical protein
LTFVGLRTFETNQKRRFLFFARDLKEKMMDGNHDEMNHGK